MKNDAWFPVIFGVLFFTIMIGAYQVINPRIEADCIAKGGQVLATPFRYSSCLYK
jgi:hypothetical protein